ncbi:hypothetical protein OG21DRAFT_519475 [Imleria badia]|nr:hypothetical protein OG21DRAFT_519475 [Imleria badia]
MPSCDSRGRTRLLSLGRDVLLGRQWLLVAVGPGLVCFDSPQYRDIQVSAPAKALFDEYTGQHLARVFSAGSVREDGIITFAVLLFEDSFTIARVLVDRGKPSEIQPVLTERSIIVEGWTDSVDVQLYHHLLVVNIGVD